MRTHSSMLVTSGLLALASLSFVRPAVADEKACLDATEQGQLARKAGKYRRARELFRTCGQPQCPSAVSRDCIGWLEELDRAQPTVVIQARDSAGRDLGTVSVAIDNEIVTRRLEGRSIDVDPGEHVFRFESGGTSVEQRVIIREAEKDRKLVVDFPAPRKPAPSPQPATAPQPQNDRGVESTGGIPASSYVLGAIGLVAAGIGTYFLVTARTDEKDMAGSCAPRCPHDDVDSVRRRYWIGGSAVGVGVAALGTAIVLALTAPKSPQHARISAPFAFAF